MVKPKGKGQWIVLKAGGDGLYEKIYSGPERAAAREKAEKILQGDKAEVLLVIRAARVVTLKADDLQASLPKSSF